MNSYEETLKTLLQHLAMCLSTYPVCYFNGTIIPQIQTAIILYQFAIMKILKCITRFTIA